MNGAVAKPWTVEEFLAWEEQQELRYEFDGFRPIAVTGGSLEHDRMQVNLLRTLGNRLEGKACRVHGNSLKIGVMGSIRYPDAFVTCTPLRRGVTVMYEPAVIFEILSKSTAYTDRTVQCPSHCTISVPHRVLVQYQSALHEEIHLSSGRLAEAIQGDAPRALVRAWIATPPSGGSP